jgi:L-malate glycosyltransferase
MLLHLQSESPRVSTCPGPAPESRRPTVCQVLHTLQVGGAEVLAAEMARHLQDRFRFVFACLDEVGTLGEELRAEGFPVWVLGRRPGLDWRCARGLADIVRREGVDLLHAHQYTPFFYASVARGLRRRTPVLFTEHGRHFPDYPRRKRMLANRLLLARRDRVVGVGHAVRQALIANEGLPPERVAVIYNGIELTPFGRGISQRQAVRSELGIGPDDFAIIQVARLDYLKDHATALRTLERVAGQRPDARLLVVGDGPERAAIETQVRERGLGDRVRLLGLRQDIPRLLQAADVFLLTSISEGIPLTLIEAMAAGLPVVSTRVGGVGEVVEDGLTGLLAPSGDDGELADHLLRLAAAPAVGRRMGQHGGARARALFARRYMHDGYAKLYGEMLGV